MTTIQITEFTSNSTNYKLKKPLILKVERNCAFNDDLGLSVVIYKRMSGQIERDAKAQLSMLWECYALCPDEKLSASGLKFKQKLLDMVEQVDEKEV